MRSMYCHKLSPLQSYDGVFIVSLTKLVTINCHVIGEKRHLTICDVIGPSPPAKTGWISVEIGPWISYYIHVEHDDVIKWKHFPRYWPLNSPVPVNSPHKGQWRGALMFTLICARINGWVNNREPGDLRRYRAHYDVIVMTVRWIFLPMPQRVTVDSPNKFWENFPML